jgi:hypothetical protein
MLVLGLFLLLMPTEGGGIQGLVSLANGGGWVLWLDDPRSRSEVG